MSTWHLSFLSFSAMLAISGCGGYSPFSSVAEGYTDQCPTTTIEGTDDYDGDGPIQWDKVKASGRYFAFVKATQGDYDTQSTFVTNWKGLRAAGMVRSAYHFFDPTIDGVTQANWFLAELAKAGGMDDLDLPPTLDAECPVDHNRDAAIAEDGHCEYPAGKTYPQNLGVEAPPACFANKQAMFDFLDTVEQATGRKPIIYTYPSWLASVEVSDARLADYPLYIASPFTCAEVPAPWTSAVFWQYSSKTAVPGITDPGDVDRFIGTADQLASFVASTLPPQDGGVRDGGRDGGSPDLIDAGEAEDQSINDDDGVGIRPEGHARGCQYGGATPATPGAWLLVGLLLALGWQRKMALRRCTRSAPRRAL